MAKVKSQMDEQGLVGLIHTVMDETPFRNFEERFTERRVRTWTTIEEKALLYGLANRFTPHGVIVELGSYCGGSAAFFAKGLAEKAGSQKGRVICVDPLLGAPPWLPLPPHMFTLSELKGNIQALGVASRIELRIGDSNAVGSIWPAEPIDILLIDGDHSLEGGLRDLECWSPKLRDGGFLLFDDIDHIAEMRSLDQIISHLTTLVRCGSVGGMGVYMVQHGGGWRLVDELQALLADRQIYRPWSFEPVHALPPSEPYRQTREWTNPVLELAYDIGYFAVQEKGNYALIANCPRELRQLVTSVWIDRGGGDLHFLRSAPKSGHKYRLIASRPEQGADVASLLLPGGVFLAWSDIPLCVEDAAQLTGAMRAAGLEGVGHGEGDCPLFWGVAEVGALNSGSIVRALMAVRKAKR